MGERTDVVVVGGGVIGASVAWHLARLGLRGVLVLDRGAAPGEGSTGQIIVAGTANETGAGITYALGGSAGSQGAGTGLFALARYNSDSSGNLSLDTAFGSNGEAGLHEARMVEPRQIAQLNPAVSLDSVIGGAFCPTDGFLRPLSILRGYLDGARRLGARIRFGEEVTALARGQDGRIEKVRLASGEISCGTVVNAAGAWAGVLGRQAGIEVPVAPLRRQVACTMPSAALPEDMPMTLWTGDGFHVRVRDGRVLLLRPTPGAADAFEAEVEDSFIREVRALAERRVPVLAGVEIDRAHCWAGLYEMSPDGHALLGWAPGCENLLLVNGSSGHGVMHAPALGALAAEMIAHGTTQSLDVRELRPSRFEEGALPGGHGLL